MDKQEALIDVYWLGIYISDKDHEDALIILDGIKKYILEEQGRKNG